MFRQHFHGMSMVLMLHRVSPVDKSNVTPNENLKVSPDYLERFIVESRSKGYQFISLDTLHDALINNKRLSKSIVLTLDDGYADNYFNAFPVFKKYDVPFAIYVTTSFPDETAILWWYNLEDLIAGNDELVLADGRRFDCSTPDKKAASFRAVRDVLVGLPEKDLLASLQRLFAPLEVDWESTVKELALTWDEIGEMSEHPLATIGAHTVNHYSLAHLSEQDAISEILESKNIIESHIRKDVEHFCYPFGSRDTAGIREFEITKELGFKTATTTKSGSVFSAHRHHLTALPRQMLSDGFSMSRYELTAIKRYLNGRVVI